MSDFYGDSLIVEEICDCYVGKVDVVFYNGDFELCFDFFFWEGICVVKGNMDFYFGYLECLVIEFGLIKII